MSEEVFLTKEKFSREVEEFIISNSSSVMEAILTKVAEKNLEFEVVKKYLTSNLIEKLSMEAEELKMVKPSEKKNTLPL